MVRLVLTSVELAIGERKAHYGWPDLLGRGEQSLSGRSFGQLAMPDWTVVLGSFLSRSALVHTCLAAPCSALQGKMVRDPRPCQERGSPLPPHMHTTDYYSVRSTPTYAYNCSLLHSQEYLSPGAVLGSVDTTDYTTSYEVRTIYAYTATNPYTTESCRELGTILDSCSRTIARAITRTNCIASEYPRSRKPNETPHVLIIFDPSHPYTTL